jgi:hypothetical protein
MRRENGTEGGKSKWHGDGEIEVGSESRKKNRKAEKVGS